MLIGWVARLLREIIGRNMALCDQIIRNSFYKLITKLWNDFGPVASARNQHCGGQGDLKDRRAEPGCMDRGVRGVQIGIWGALYKLPQWGPPRVLVHSGVLRVSSPAVLLCKTVCNQLINLAYYCGSESIPRTLRRRVPQLHSTVPTK